MHHLKLAAIGGHETARTILVQWSIIMDNMVKAMKHYMILAGSGYDKALNFIKEGYKDGHVTKEE